jgi:hypothetical protein
VINSAGLQSLPWKGVIGSRDAMLWALDRVPVTLDPLLGRLAVETAVSLAGWDIELAASFVEDFVATPRRMFDVSRIPSGAARAGRWVDGTFDMLDGVAFPALGCCCQEEVMRRFWRAQVTVLFGWLETERSLFVRRHNRALLECVRRLHPPAADLDAMEWAEISRLMKVAFAAGDRQVELANEARLARNALAHLQSIDYARFARIRSLARDNSSKRGDAAA